MFLLRLTKKNLTPNQQSKSSLTPEVTEKSLTTLTSQGPAAPTVQ